MMLCKFNAPVFCVRIGIYGPYFSDGAALEVHQAIKSELRTEGLYWKPIMSGPILRIRKTDGTTQDVQKGVFVEVCDEDGKIGAVVYQTSNGTIRVITPEDEKDVDHYKGIFNVHFCTSVLDVKQTINDSYNRKSS